MVSSIGRVTAGSTASLTTAARSWAEGIDFSDDATVARLAISRAKAPTTGPTSLQRAYALYRSWENNDLGSVRLLSTSVGNQTVYALHTTTDGDDGFIELYSKSGSLLASGVTGFNANGTRNVTWDSKPGDVRNRVAPTDREPAIASFFEAIGKAKATTSPSGATLSTDELRTAAKTLVGDELTTRSVDGWENAALFRVLADPSTKLTSTSRAYAEQLTKLYDSAPGVSLTSKTEKALGSTSDFARSARLATGKVPANAAPGLNTMITFARESWNLLPTQVVPITKTEAQKLLKNAGATASEAKAATEKLADAKGQLYAGALYDQGSNWVPAAKGTVLFGVNGTGKAMAALQVPARATPPTGAVPRDVVRSMLGVDREVEVVSRTQTNTGETFALRWRPPIGGTIEASLAVPSNGDAPSISNLTMPPVKEAVLEQKLAADLAAARGTPQHVLGWVGRDNAQGPGFVVVHERDDGNGPATLSTVRYALGGIATVANLTLGTSANDQGLARDLAINLARAHAEKMVADSVGADDAKLEVALRTRWMQQSDLKATTAQSSAVGFDPAIERTQLMLSRVWGDNAVFVTFAKNGEVRVEDFN